MLLYIYQLDRRCIPTGAGLEAGCQAAKLAARRLTRRRDKEKSLKRTEAWRSEAEEEEHEEDEEPIQVRNPCDFAMF